MSGDRAYETYSDKEYDLFLRSLLNSKRPNTSYEGNETNNKSVVVQTPAPSHRIAFPIQSQNKFLYPTVQHSMLFILSASPPP
ncbi:hypothetical protein G7K_6244-t1 [Saitoella complicata NRRL Y-17804]|uniref:Uncharacterized protein n=1 Tax=Saitoella complicata (strain BCRC 22490 / CBS 7301 / JCM 7358 / NBRC 10748 / NRRL Y-17804) TaxID=698492 RepID=A0A0E9NQT4_SAICN|nr:hypothetical protein G7K_6244-t1 [Saitoella complicata NRRL Y-17804]